MLRRVLFVLAGLAVAAVLAADRSPKAVAADPEVAGNFLFTTVGTGTESVTCIIKVEAKDGKPDASVVFSPPNVTVTLSNFSVTDKTVTFSLKQTQKFNGREFSNETTFVGVRGKDAKVVFGSTGDSRFRGRAKLTATDKEKLAPNELVIRGDVPKPMTDALQLGNKAAIAQQKMFQEKDAEKRKELQKEFTAAFTEMNEKQPDLFREVVEKHPDNPVAFDAALNLIRTASRAKVKPDEADKLIKLLQKHAEPYGSLFAGVTAVQAASALLSQAELAPMAFVAIEPAAKALKEDQPDEFQYEVLDTYKAALAKANKNEEAKALEPRLAKLDKRLDEAALKGPPFKTAAFAGRKDASANRVAVMELFTGAQCPPCVAADLAFDGLLKTYKPTDVILIQYHVHIPGPDPLTTPDTTARFNYYQKQFPMEVRGAPSTVFNGKPQAGGGGGVAAGAGKYKEYTEVINPLLEKTTETKLGGKASRTGDKIDIAVEVTGGDGDDMKLRLLVVEESIKYVGGNRIRFHHHVVRAMPGGADGVAIKDKTVKHTATVDLAEVRKELTKYLDDFAANTRPFPKPDRPMDMKALRVIALVQNDKTKEILQAVQIEVEGKAAGGGGR